jgi:hypothetical protein
LRQIKRRRFFAALGASATVVAAAGERPRSCAKSTDGGNCALQKDLLADPCFVAKCWHVRSLIIQAKYGTFAATERLICYPSFCCSRLDEKGDAMKKSLMALAAVATLAISAVAAPAPAHAQRGLGVGLAAGLLGGAIVGGALAAPYGYGPGYGYYGPGYGYYGGPAYVADDYYGGCAWQRQRFWDGFGWRVRNVRICG